MRWLTIVVAVLGVALVGAGCGGGDDEASGDDSSITVTTETTEDTDTDTSGSIEDVSEDCLAAVSAFAALGQAVGTAATGVDTGAEDSAEVFREFADRAPDEIQDDIRVLAEAYAGYVQELGDLNLQPGETPSADQIQQLTQAAERLNTPEIAAASEDFNTWATANCPG